MILSLCACGGDDDKGDDSETSGGTVKAETETEYQNSTEETDTEQESFQKLDERYVAGDTIKFKSGLEIYIADVGTYDNRSVGGDGLYVYVELELTNNGDETMDFNSTMVEFYADDYALADANSALLADDFLGIMTINIGRKARGRCYQL